MTDIASLDKLAAVESQLPVSAYFDEQLFEQERRILFDAGPGYVGHACMVPEEADFHTLAWQDHARMLVNNPDGAYLMSNICRHRQAIMLQGRGKANKIACPVHRWAYDQEGQLLGAPRFPQNPCLHLDRQKLESWQGLLFKGPRSANADLAGMRLAPALDFSGYVLNRIELHACNYNWKTFIEVYLEDYHVAPFHPGLGRFVTCDDLSWQFGNWYSVQRVGLNKLDRPGSPAYARWHRAVEEKYKGEAPPHGAIWLTYFPNVMVEWYPHVLVVSHLVPQGVQKTLNVVEFYYPEEIAADAAFVEAEQAAYMETAIEDDEIGERMDRGRRALWLAGRNEVGPYQSPLEDGMQHFHAFYRRMMGAHLNDVA
jgi:choline monooxygenase